MYTRLRDTVSTSLPALTDNKFEPTDRGHLQMHTVNKAPRASL